MVGLVVSLDGVDDEMCNLDTPFKLLAAYEAGAECSKLYLVASGFRHVADPLNAAVVVLFEDFQVPYQKSRAGKHEQRECHAQWRP